MRFHLGQAHRMDSKEATDLWRQFVETGDTSAFDRLYRAYRVRVMRYCRARLRDEEAADDVTDRTFTYLFMAKPLCTTTFEAMAIFYARLRCLNYRSPSSFPLPTPPPSAESPSESEIERLEECEAVQRKLSQLTEEQREIVCLRFFHNMTFDEIAGVLQTTRSKIKTRCRKALRELKWIFREI